MIEKLAVKLTQDEEDALLAILDHAGWKSLSKILYNLELGFIKNTMSYNLDQGPDGLIRLKAKAEGVRSFITQLEQLSDQKLGKNKTSRRR